MRWKRDRARKGMKMGTAPSSIWGHEEASGRQELTFWRWVKVRVPQNIKSSCMDISSWRTWGATKSIWTRVQQAPSCVWKRVNVTVVCRMVWGGEDAGRETMCPYHLMVAPTEINKGLLTDWQPGWLTHCLQTTHPSPAEDPSFRTNHNGSSTWTQGQNSEAKMVGKRHNLSTVNRERLKTRNHLTSPRKQTSREGCQWREKHPQWTECNLDSFPLFLVLNRERKMHGSCTKMMVLFPHVRIWGNLAITFY